MSDQDQLAESVAAMGRFFLGQSTLLDALQHVVDLSAAAVPAAAYTGAALLVEDRLTTAICSDPDVPEIDQAQYDTGNGPCLDAFRHGRVYGIPSTWRDERWREFSQAALAHGIGSTLSLPLVIGEHHIGALNFYSEQENAFAESDQRSAELFAAQAAAMLANAQLYADARTLSEHLSEAMRSRAVIEQAKGILIAQSGVDADAAFQLLKRASQRENRKLRDIAQALVDRHSGGTSG